jgi:hypothetical protein
LPHRENLLHRARQDVGYEIQDVADATIDRDRIPGIGDAERIDLSLSKTVHHIGQRQHDQPNVLLGIDASRRNPEPQLVIVGGKRKGYAEGQRRRAAPAPSSYDARQCQRGNHGIKRIAFDLAQDRRMQCRRHRDRIAVKAEVERRDKRHLDVAKSKARRDRDRCHQMRCVE